MKSCNTQSQRLATVDTPRGAAVPGTPGETLVATPRIADCTRHAALLPFEPHPAQLCAAAAAEPEPRLGLLRRLAGADARLSTGSSAPFDRS